MFANIRTIREIRNFLKDFLSGLWYFMGFIVKNMGVESAHMFCVERRSLT